MTGKPNEPNYLKYLEVDFYHVEKIDNVTYIHDNGYVYINGEGEYRNLEYTFLYLEPERMRKESNYYDMMQEKVNQYIGDLDEEGAIRTLKNLLGSSRPLPMIEVTDETPCGWYRDCNF